MGKDAKGHGSNPKGADYARQMGKEAGSAGKSLKSLMRSTDVKPGTKTALAMSAGHYEGRSSKGAGASTFVAPKMTAAEAKRIDAEVANRERAAATMKAIKAERKAGVKPEPRGKLFNDSAKTKREVAQVAKIGRNAQGGAVLMGRAAPGKKGT